MPYQEPDKEIQGWMDRICLEWLYARASECDSVLEVGSWKGRSTHAILSGCKGPVIAVDHFLGSPDERDGAHAEVKDLDIFAEFWKNVGHFKNLIVMRMDSFAAAKLIAPRSVDMVFIDATHSRDAVLLDLISWYPKARKFICGHDAGYETIQAALKDYGILTISKSDDGGIWRVNV